MYDLTTLMEEAIMGGEQLTILEQRIEKAISLIEELKSREKKFANEKKLLEKRIE